MPRKYAVFETKNEDQPPESISDPHARRGQMHQMRQAGGAFNTAKCLKFNK
jgi:hypothetical protein